MFDETLETNWSINEAYVQNFNEKSIGSHNQKILREVENQLLTRIVTILYNIKNKVFSSEQRQCK